MVNFRNFIVAAATYICRLEIVTVSVTPNFILPTLCAVNRDATFGFNIS
jgi:hypothetical protein